MNYYAKNRINHDKKPSKTLLTINLLFMIVFVLNVAFRSTLFNDRDHVKKQH